MPDHRFFQLGIEGTSGLPVLEDLAANAAFRGSVVCEFNPVHWLEPYPFANRVPRLDYIHPRASGEYVESVLVEELREHFSFFGHNIRQYANLVSSGERPRPKRADRYEPYVGDHTKVLLRNWLRGVQISVEGIRRAGPSSLPRHVLSWANRIRSRGGNVIFVRMPVDGELRTAEEAAFPQMSQLVSQLRASGFKVVDFADMHEHFWCPDGSHLEIKGSARFSHVLAQDLKTERFFGGL